MVVGVVSIFGALWTILVQLMAVVSGMLCAVFWTLMTPICCVVALVCAVASFVCLGAGLIYGMCWASKDALVYMNVLEPSHMMGHAPQPQARQTS